MEPEYEWPMLHDDAPAGLPAPTSAARLAVAVVDLPAGCPGRDLLPGLTYCDHDRPAFDGSARRYDRRASNPDWNPAHPRWQEGERRR